MSRHLELFDGVVDTFTGRFAKVATRQDYLDTIEEIAGEVYRQQYETADMAVLRRVTRMIVRPDPSPRRYHTNRRYCVDPEATL
jgi:hypothetical protein